MFKLTFQKLYAATEATIKDLKAPIVRARNIRAFEAAIDSAKMKQYDAEEALEKLLSVVIQGNVIDINKCLEQRQIMSNCEATIKELEKFKKEFFAEEKEA